MSDNSDFCWAQIGDTQIKIPASERRTNTGCNFISLIKRAPAANPSAAMSLGAKHGYSTRFGLPSACFRPRRRTESRNGRLEAVSALFVALFARKCLVLEFFVYWLVHGASWLTHLCAGICLHRAGGKTVDLMGINILETPRLWCVRNLNDTLAIAENAWNCICKRLNRLDLGT